MTREAARKAVADMVRRLAIEQEWSQQPDDVHSSCEHVGSMGMHSDAYYEDEPGSCSWCGRENTPSVAK